MTNYELYKSGALDEAEAKGLLKNNVKLYCDVYQAFMLSRGKGNRYEVAVEDTSDSMCVSTRTVKRAIVFARK